MNLRSVVRPLSPFALCLSALGIAACAGNKPPTPAQPDQAAVASDAGATDLAPKENNAGSTTLAVGGDDAGSKTGEKLPAADAGAKATGEPGRGRDDIMARIQAKRAEARACYDEGLKKHPGIEGNLTVKWVIDPKGEVTNVEVDTMKSQIMEPSVQECVVAIIKKLKFPESPGGKETRANYPFDFHPRDGQPAKK